MVQTSCTPSAAKSKQKARPAGKGEKGHGGNTVTDGSYRGFTTTAETYAHDIFRSVVKGHDIEPFLDESQCYDRTLKRWTVPQAPGSTDTLVDSMFRIISSIVRRFIKTDELGVMRKVINARAIPGGEGSNEQGYRICQVIVVQAAGPSFELPKPLDRSVPSNPPPKSLSFANMATFFIVKPESELGTVKKIVDEMTTYASYIFNDQPNRFHVRCLLLTERRACLVHFDRAGTQVTPLFDIHKHPHTLVRLIAGISSANEGLLGLDDSIQWTIADGRKANGTLTTVAPSGELKAYPIIGRIPIPLEAISGRATMCWRVQDPDSLEEYVVKDSWRPGDRPAEYELLKLVEGIPGVVQMVSYETDRGEAKDFRCPSTAGRYENRISTRIAMKSYGSTIEAFTSALQLICAIRDVVASHQRLVGDDLRILHRDISQHNILLGHEGAAEGERGVLIDLDMAFQATDAVPTVRADYTIGTRLFQSFWVLESFNVGKKTPAHDYLDELESFFYLLAYMFLLYKPDGSRVPSSEVGPPFVRGWGAVMPNDARYNRRALFGCGRLPSLLQKQVEDFWGPICSALLTAFRDWTEDMQDTKIRLVNAQARRKIVYSLTSLHSHRDEHYAAVLGLFDQAIASLTAAVTVPSGAF